MRATPIRPSSAPVANGGILHYTRNSAAIEDGDLVLIDAGCELDYYAADVTRTLPANGRYSPEQRAVYEIVLAAQTAAVDKIRSGNHWDDPHRAAVREITRGLKSLGLLSGPLAKLLRDDAAKPYYLHRTGHWLGMDVHDVGDYRVGTEWRLFEPGMATTVEPGVYLSDSKDLPRKWRNIAIRIEDDVVVTKDDPAVLTGDLVREPDDIEAAMHA